MSEISSFRFETTPEAVADLHRRLDTQRWPDEIEVADSRYGLRGDMLRELLHYWRNEFDWFSAQARINTFPQFRIDLDGLPLHFLHVRSPHAEASPLLITHGWPGSIVEFLDVIPRLTEPERYGGDAADAFHVVCPSLQGYGGSPGSLQPGMNPTVIAQRHIRLMAALGYARYVIQGGDWGSRVSHCTAAFAPQAAIGLHLNLLVPIPPKSLADPMASVLPHEQYRLAAADRYQRELSGYFQAQSTRPQTLAYALSDSPAGWCAWIAEKFLEWADCERDGVRDIRNAVSWDALLTNISLYWFSGTIASSIRLYREQQLALNAGERLPRVTTPTGLAAYPAELFMAPRAWAEAQLPLVHWYEAPKGGHFAAMEQPALFAADLWQFHRVLRALPTH